MSKHTLNWEVDDGYCGSSRPQSLRVYADDFGANATLEVIKDLLAEYVQDDFDQKVSWSCDNLDEVAQAIYDELQAEADES
jgi:hypothetical protein